MSTLMRNVSKGERGQFMDDNRDAADSGVAHRPEKRNDDKERASLRVFFENIWKENVDSFVFFTRKCFNLNQRFFLEARREETSDFNKMLKIEKRFLSQNALLALAPLLVEQYHENGSFPSMLLADELVTYGRAISSYMVMLENAVIHAYQSLYEPIDSREERKLRAAFLDAIQIRIYMGHCKNLYLETRFQKRLKIQYPQAEFSRSRSLMQQIPLWLREEREDKKNVERAAVELTSYAPFFRLDKQEYAAFHAYMERNEAWHCRSWLYHGLKADICQKIELHSPEGAQLLQTFRCHKEADNSVRVVPLSLFRGVSFSALDSLCNELAETLKAATHENASAQMHYIYELLSNRIPIEEASHIRLQMVSFLLSVTLFYEVIDGARISWTPIKTVKSPQDPPCNHDLDKVAVNFGKRENVYEASFFLCGKDGAKTRGKLREVLMSHLKSALIPFENSANDRFGEKTEKLSPFEADDYFRMAENFFHEGGLRDERRLPEMYSSGIGYSGGIRSDIYDFLQTYYRKMKGANANGAFNLETATGTLLMLMDCGVISMVTREYNLGGGHWHGLCILNCLRAGELSQRIRIQRFYRFVPALIRIERRCNWLGYPVAEYAARFGCLLDAKEPGQNLENGFKDLVLHTYQSNQRMEDWDIDLLVDLDKPLRDKEGNCYRRLRKEWCGAEGVKWDDEEWKQFDSFTTDEYREYEKGMQDRYCDILKREFPIV